MPPSLSHRYFASFLLYTLINGLLVLGSVCVTLYLGPAAAGSGIPEVKVREKACHGKVAICLPSSRSNSPACLPLAFTRI